MTGDKVTANECMIRYMSQAVKHSLKVFAVCCTYTVVLLGFEIYCGIDSNDNQDKSALGVI